MDKTFNTWENPLLMLKLIGLFSETRTRRIITLATLYSILLLFINIMILIQFSTIKGDIFEIIDNVEALSSFSQALGKIILIAYQQDKLLNILTDIKRFWKTSVASNTLKLKLDTFRINISRLQNLFLCALAATVCLAELVSCLNRVLAVGTWNLKGYDFLYQLTFFSQLVAVPIVTTAVYGFDSLFLSFCTETVIQFKVLCYCLQELSVSKISSQKEYYTKIKTYIKHHVFLLRFAGSLQSYFSVGLLIEYVTISSCTCTIMYALFEVKSVQLLAKHGAMGLCVLVQLAFYCFTAHFVSSEVLAVSDAIYYSDWYSKHDSRLVVPLTLIIQRSQHRFFFTAGGLIEINIRTLLVVLRVSWSACTIMRALKSSN